MPEPLVFPGVRSSRFIGYLHGLALLRIVTEQLDPAARGAWSRGAFALTTGATRDELVAFFVERWVPTPVVSPWNGGSGFHPKDKESRDALLAIEASDDPRLEGVRAVIAAARAAVHRFALDGPPDAKRKPAFLQHLRAVLPEPGLAWLDAAVVIAGAGVAFPPALGTGGNDGRYDLSSNNAQCLGELLGLGLKRRGPSPDALLRGVLDGTSVPGRAMSLGHLVRDVSPVGSPAGENAGLANLWDLPLAIEGVVLLAAGATRRGESGVPAQAAAPFSFGTSGGYGSAVAGEAGRAEQWMPQWTAPAALAEVRSLLREGRASVGRRRASSGLDVARAAGDLGVARGIAAFERFSILERSGQSNLTLHAGTIEVRERPAVRALRGLDTGNWLSRVLAASGESTATAKRQAARGLAEAAFAMAARGRPEDVERMLGRLGEIELVLARGAQVVTVSGDP
ncbi:MAG: type I-U CRISPR-associated protein Csx17, partial [Solirubrobacteraceae bacterium]